MKSSYWVLVYVILLAVTGISDCLDGSWGQSTESGASLELMRVKTGTEGTELRFGI